MTTNKLNNISKLHGFLGGSSQVKDVRYNGRNPYLNQGPKPWTTNLFFSSKRDQTTISQMKMNQYKFSNISSQMRFLESNSISKKEKVGALGLSNYRLEEQYSKRESLRLDRLLTQVNKDFKLDFRYEIPSIAINPDDSEIKIDLNQIDTKDMTPVEVEDSIGSLVNNIIEFVTEHRSEIADIAQTGLKIGIYLGAISYLTKEDATLLGRIGTQLQAALFATGVSVAVTSLRVNNETVSKIAPVSEQKGTASKLIPGMIGAGIAAALLQDPIPVASVIAMSLRNETAQENKDLAVLTAASTFVKKVEEGKTVQEAAKKAVVQATTTYVAADIATGKTGIKSKIKEWAVYLIFQPYQKMDKEKWFTAKNIKLGLELMARITLAVLVMTSLVGMVYTSLQPAIVAMELTVKGGQMGIMGLGKVASMISSGKLAFVSAMFA
jgi:hypothetical protein